MSASMSEPSIRPWDGKFSKYFDNERHSDVTIKLEGFNIKAHKIILCEHSKYFESLLEGDGEADKPFEIELKDDNPQAIKGLIASLYGLQYDSVSKTAPSFKDLVPEGSLDAGYCFYLVNLFVVSGKYGMTAWQRRTGDIFEEAIKWIAAEKDGYPVDLEAVSRHVFDHHSHAAIELRAAVVQEFLKYLPKIKEEPRFEKLMNDHPSLAVLLMRGLLNDSEGNHTSTKAAGSIASADDTRATKRMKVEDGTTPTTAMPASVPTSSRRKRGCRGSGNGAASASSGAGSGSVQGESNFGRLNAPPNSAFATQFGARPSPDASIDSLWSNQQPVTGPLKGGGDVSSLARQQALRGGARGRGS